MGWGKTVDSGLGLLKCERIVVVGGFFYCLPPRSGGQADIDSKAGPII